jgi:hypothetical protein
VVTVRGNDTLEPSPYQQGGKYARANTNLKCQCVIANGDCCYEVNVLTTQGGEDTVVGIDTIVWRSTQGIDLYAIFSPLISTHNTKQLAQRDHAGLT